MFEQQSPSSVETLSSGGIRKPLNVRNQGELRLLVESGSRPRVTQHVLNLSVPEPQLSSTARVGYRVRLVRQVTQLFIEADKKHTV